MSDAVRGRVLIINIYTILEGTREEIHRTGSDVDYRNLSRLFKVLKFDVVKEEKHLTNLTAQVGSRLL